MAKMIDVTLVWGIYDQPTSETVISINSEEICVINVNPSGNSAAIIKTKNKRTYYLKETKQELINKIAPWKRKSKLR